MKEKIDFVLPWVDGSDEAWLKERRKYEEGNGADNGESRYRDWDNLNYWFRGVERFAPWVNRIFFVTWGHLPKWLNTGHPKLTVVNHRDYIPEKYLPVFSSHPIELNMHRIPGLSEKFVYFNDDTFLLRETSPEDFFKNGLPRDCCIETALAQNDINNPFAHILMNNTALVNMHYNKRAVIKKNKKKWFHPSYGSMLLRNFLMLPYQEFSGFKYTHLPSAFLKSTFEKVWEEEGAVLDRVCCNRFRCARDVNQYLMKYWQYMEGQYEPQSPNIGKFCIAGRDDKALFDTLANQSAKMLCINDDSSVQNFEEMRQQVLDAFGKILPEKSEFEL